MPGVCVPGRNGDPQLTAVPCVQVVMLSSVSDLLTYIDEQQLTPELGGTLEYCHSEWVIFRTVSAAGRGLSAGCGSPRRVGTQAASTGWAESNPQSHCTSWVRRAKEPRGVEL